MSGGVLGFVPERGRLLQLLYVLITSRATGDPRALVAVLHLV